jgi:hypothetical protein
MRGVFAQFERDTVSERTKAMHAWLRSQGRVQSRTPFGFLVNGERRLERDPATWPVLVSMMERVAAGESLRQLGTEYGLPHTTIRVYVRNRKALDSLEEDRPDLAAALRARFEDDTYRPGRRALLSGLASCSVCYTPLRQGRRGGVRIYECKDSGHVRVGADWLDELVVGDVLRLLGSHALPQRRVEPAAREDRAALERKLEELQDEYDDGLMSRERYVTRRDRLLAKLERAGIAAPRPRLETTQWEKLTHDEQRLALREVFDGIEVRPVPDGKPRGRHHAGRVVLHFK